MTHITTRRGRADLHVHTLYSDGGQAPEAIVRAAAGCLDVVAKTDHDRVAGAFRARDYAREHPELGGDVVVGEEVSRVNGHPSEVVNNAGVFSRLYDALAAPRNVEWILPVTAGSDAHDVWYLGSAVTAFPGGDAAALRGALETGRTRAQVDWSWTASKIPRHVRIQSRSAIRFLQGGHRGYS